MVRKDPVKIFEAIGYTKKTITIRPDKDNQVFTFEQVKKYYEDAKKTFPANSVVTVRALNILRDTTLKGPNTEFMSEEEYDDYIEGKVEDSSKFEYFFNFTITIRIDK
jgi:hypothetical protein